LSLARGLDYYTGIIYEAVVEASAPPAFQANASALADGATKPKKVGPDGEDEVDESTVGVGSIAAGGRYDNLVGMFTSAAAGEPSGKKGKAAQLPCVGVSIGMDRIFALVWPKWVEKGMRSKNTMAFVLAAGEGLLKERIDLVKELREAGIQVGRCSWVYVYMTHLLRRRTFWPRLSQKSGINLTPESETKFHLQLF
jgi:histidyl-tRNA synthetase